jgi:hypothetical protein
MSNCGCEEKNHNHRPNKCDKPAATADGCCEECIAEITMAGFEKESTENPHPPPNVRTGSGG